MNPNPSTRPTRAERCELDSFDPAFAPSPVNEVSDFALELASVIDAIDPSDVPRQTVMAAHIIRVLWESDANRVKALFAEHKAGPLTKKLVNGLVDAMIQTSNSLRTKAQNHSDDSAKPEPGSLRWRLANVGKGMDE